MGKNKCREEWLAERCNGIGASDAPKILGLVPQCSYLSWHLQKTGEIEGPSENLMMWLGHDLEPTITRLYEKEVGSTLINPGDHTILWSKEHDWLFCTPDRLAQPKINVELKLVFPQLGRNLPYGEALLSHLVQAQVQMKVLDLKKTHIAVLNLYGPDFYIVDVERDDSFLEAIIPELKVAWDCVVNRTPPEVDGSDSTRKAIRALHPDDNGEIVNLPEEFEVDLARLTELEIELDEMSFEAQSIKNKIMFEMGPNTYAFLNGERVFSYKTQKTAGGKTARILRRVK